MKFQNLFGREPSGTNYLEALKAMECLLSSQNQTHWRDWILRDIEEWEDRRSVSHHLSAYGGMGSFNDLAFECPRIAYLFEDLKSICYFVAHSPSAQANSKLVEPRMGSAVSVLSGWRCLSCGYQVASTSDIEWFIASGIIRESILNALDEGHLLQFVVSVIRELPDHDDFKYQSVAEGAKASGINLRSENGWLRPCPECGSNDTAVYRWCLANKRDFHFEPSTDNLPLRKKA